MTVRNEQPVRPSTGDIGPPVLPDDAHRLRVKDDDPMPEVVVDGHRPIRQRCREAWMIESTGPGPRPVSPQDPAARADGKDLARVAVVGDDHVPVPVELSVGRIERRHMDVEEHLPRR